MQSDNKDSPGNSLSHINRMHITTVALFKCDNIDTSSLVNSPPMLY